MNAKACEGNSGMTRYQKAMEEYGLLITTLSYHLPQLIYVMENNARKILFSNHNASLVTDSKLFSEQLASFFFQNPARFRTGCALEFEYHGPLGMEYYTLSAYPLLWEGCEATALILNDITEERGALIKKTFPHQDEMTKLHNRLSGMMIFNKWLDMKRSFSLCFCNLDNIKKINEIYGREEGDQFITLVSQLLLGFSSDTIVCRVGGDEFMLLAPGFTEEESRARMDSICTELKSCAFEKPYYSNISYGIVEVTEANHDSASKLLTLADERMHASKLLNKQNRLLTI